MSFINNNIKTYLIDEIVFYKVQSWPIFLLVNCYGGSIQYRGPISKSHMTRFLNTAINPLHRITKPDDIVDLLARYDVNNINILNVYLFIIYMLSLIFFKAVIVGYVDFKYFPTSYDILYKTALKWIDHEPYNEIGFAVVTGHSRDSFGVNSLPSYRIYLWNETLVIISSN